MVELDGSWWDGKTVVGVVERRAVGVGRAVGVVGMGCGADGAGAADGAAVGRRRREGCSYVAEDEGRPEGSSTLKKDEIH